MLKENIANSKCQNSNVDLESDMPIGKDGEKGNIKKPQFSMPKISLPKMKGHKGQVSLPKLESDVSEFSKFETKAPKMAMDVSLPTVDLTLPTYDATIQQADLKLRSAGADVGLSSPDIKIPTSEGSTELQSPEIGVEGISAGIAVDGAEMKVEGLEGKIKMPKVQNPKFAISHPKGKVPESEINLSKMEADVPQLKAMTDIVDIAVEAPTIEVESAIPNAETESSGWKTEMPKISEADIKTPKVDINLQSNISVPMTEISIQDSNMMPKFGALHSKAKGSEVDVFLPKLEAEVSLPKTELGIVDFQFKKADGSIDLQSPSSDLMEPSTGISKDKPDKQSESVEINIKIPKLKIPAFTYNAPTAETDISTSKVFAGGNIQTPSVKIPTLAECDIKTSQVYVKLPSTDFSVSKAALQIQGPLAEGKDIKIQSEVESGHGDIETRETYTSQIVKESEIPSSEIKTASFGFSLLKVKIPESHVKLDMPVKPQSYTEYKHEVSKSEVHQPKLSDATLGVAIQKTDSAESKLSGKQQNETDESNDVISSSVTVSPLSKDDKIAKIPEDEEKDMKDEKEKTDSKRSSGRFKFWLPSIGFSSSVDDTGSDSKPEVQKSIPEEIQPVDSSASDTDSSKQTEKTGWFRFPKLGFSSPSKKAKNIDKEEETNLKEMKTSDDESPSEKPETFFDAEESLSPKEETIKGEENETTGTSSNVQVSGAIVTSSARTELILLEREKASQVDNI
uniref:Protein AHNAK2 n=1 Tax=Gopherus evgoodei TaxID=1825980 RepID=A0A8C4VMK6_9SAUR